MKRTRIAFVLTNFGVGGAERQFWYLIDSIDRDLYDVHVLLISHTSRKPKIIENPTAHIRKYEMKWRFDIRIVFRLVKYIRANGIDLIQSQLFMDNQIARLVGLLCRRPVITSIRGEPNSRWFANRLEFGLQWLSAHFVVNSHWLKSAVVENGVAPQKITVIHNGIDPSSFQCPHDRGALRQKYGIPPESRVIGIVARLDPVKDHHTFFDVVRMVKEEIPNIFAVVVGAGEIRRDLERYVEEIKIKENTLFLGEVTDELPEVLRIMDVFLLTSKRESFPNVLLESTSAGVPIIASNIHGIPEIVEDKVNGFLTDVGDSAQMARRVIELLLDSSLRSCLAEKGLERVQEFSIPVMVRKYEKLYAEIFVPSER